MKFIIGFCALIAVSAIPVEKNEKPTLNMFRENNTIKYMECISDLLTQNHINIEKEPTNSLSGTIFLTFIQGICADLPGAIKCIDDYDQTLRNIDYTNYELDMGEYKGIIFFSHYIKTIYNHFCSDYRDIILKFIRDGGIRCFSADFDCDKYVHEISKPNKNGFLIYPVYNATDCLLIENTKKCTIEKFNEKCENSHITDFFGILSDDIKERMGCSLFKV